MSPATQQIELPRSPVFASSEDTINAIQWAIGLVVQNLQNRRLDPITHVAALICGYRVEAIGAYSNTGHLCKKWADLCKSIIEMPPRSPLSRQDDPKPRSKRFLTPNDLVDIATRYKAGATTNAIASHYGVSKTRVATVLRGQGITILVKA